MEEGKSKNLGKGVAEGEEVDGNENPDEGLCEGFKEQIPVDLLEFALDLEELLDVGVGYMHGYNWVRMIIRLW